MFEQSRSGPKSWRTKKLLASRPSSGFIYTDNCHAKCSPYRTVMLTCLLVSYSCLSMHQRQNRKLLSEANLSNNNEVDLFTVSQRCRRRYIAEQFVRLSHPLTSVTADSTARSHRPLTFHAFLPQKLCINFHV